MSDIKVQFGKRLRELRESQGFSQESLAHEAELDRTYISGVERGKRNISIENIQRLALALNIGVKDFFNHEDFENYADNSTSG